MNTAMTMLAQAANTKVTLTTGGVIVMTLSTLLVLGLVVFCLAWILREKRPEQHDHAPLDIDTSHKQTP